MGAITIMMDIIVFVGGLVLSIGGGLIGSFVLTLIALACCGKCSEMEIKKDENDGLIWTMAINFFILCLYTTAYFLIRYHYVGR